MAVRKASFAAWMATMLGLVAAAAFSFDAAAQMDHTQHKMPAMPKKPELGTSVEIDAQGRLWAASKEMEGASQYVVLQVSEDKGRTWSARRRIASEPEGISADGENRPKIAFGTRGELYVSYTKPLAKPFTGEIRFVRSLDGGKTFQPAITVHANRDVITHRFDSMIVDRDGRIYITWIDKRDGVAASERGEKYRGAAVYYAVSDDGGASFKGDYKLADHTCECCRIALALHPDGRPMAFWRHVFAPNIRDHAMAALTPDGRPGEVTRATFDDWRIDACPHHGPSLAFASDGTRHQVWFNAKGEDGGVFYARATPNGELGKPERLGSPQAARADIAVDGNMVVLAWKQFDGKSTAALARVSTDGGLTWYERELARTERDSDHTHLLRTPSGIVLTWRTQGEGVLVIPVKPEN